MITTETLDIRKDAFFRLLTETMRDIFCIVDPNGIVRYVSPSVESVLGFSADELSGRPVISFIHPSDRRIALSVFKRSQTTGYGQSLDIRLLHREGSFRCFRAAGSWEYDDDGTPLHAVVTCRENTEQTDAVDRINNSEQKFRTIFNNANDAIFLLRGDVIIDCNPATEKLFGCRRTELLNRTPYEFSPQYQPDGRDSREKALEKIRRVLDGYPQTFEWTHRKVNGIVFEAEINLNKLEIGSEELIQAIVRDISARKMSESELRYRIELEKLVAGISTNFINLPFDELDKGLINVLEDIGMFAGVDRSYIFLYDKPNSRFRNIEAWAADDFGDSCRQLGDLHGNDIPWWLKKLERFEEIRIADVSLLPGLASQEKKLLESMCVKSVLAVPLRIQKELIGFLGFDTITETRNWSLDHVTLLSITGEIITNALERKRRETELNRSAGQRKRLLDVSRSIFSSFDVQQIIRHSASVLKDLTEFDSAYLVWERKLSGALGAGYLIDRNGALNHLGDEGLPANLQKMHELVAAGNAALLNSRNGAGNVVAIPMQTKDRTLGMFIVNRKSSGFLNGEFEHIQLLSGYMTVALDNALLYKEVRQRESINSALLETALTVSEAREVEQTFRNLAEQALGLIKVDRCAVYMARDSEDVLEPIVVISPSPEDVDYLRRERIGFTEVPAIGAVLRDPMPLIINDVALSGLIPERYIRALDLKSVLIIPFMKNGRLIGGIVLNSTSPDHTFTDEDRRAATGIANQAIVALDNARLFEELQRKLVFNEALADVSSALNSVADLDDILTLILDKMLALTRAKHGSLMLIDSEKNELFIRAARGLSDEAVLRTRLRIGEGIAGRVAASGEIIYSDNIPQDPRFKHFNGEQIYSLLTIPMKLKGEVLGVINLDTIEGERTIDPDDIHLTEEFAKQAAFAIENARLFEQIKDSEEKFRSLFEDMKDTIFSTTEEGRLVDINPAGINLLGYNSKEELLNLDIGKDLYVDPERRDEYRKEIKDKGFVKDFEAQLKRRDGAVITVHITSSAVPDRKTGRTMFRGFLRDVTAQKRLEDQLRQTQKMESLGQLAGGIAHDFNNVLGIIQVSLSSLRTKVRDSDNDLIRYVEMGENAVSRGADVARRLLTFAQSSEVKLNPIAINDVIKDLSNVLLHTIEKNIAIQTVIDDDLPMVMGDHGQLYQMLLNLCLNARDAILDASSFNNNGILNITVDMNTDGVLIAENQEKRFVRIAISDNGTGIPEDIRQRIFDPFFTTKAKDRGTGLGLSVVYGIVQVHKGTIQCESEPGKGTTFTVYLPVTGTAQRPISTENTQQIVGGTEKILVVEDEKVLQTLLAEVLSGKGYTVITASDGEEGLQIYREHKDELCGVVLDMGLPKLPGQALFLKMRQINPKPGIILASGYLDEELKRDLFELGAGAFIYKPYKATEILRTVRDVLDARKNGV